MKTETTAWSALGAFSRSEPGRWTLSYYLLFIGLGLGMALIGPTLPALAAQTGAPLGRMGWLFLAGSVGGTLGTFVGGRIFDHVRGHPVMGGAQLASAVLLGLMPFVPWFWLLLAAAACKGFADGLVNTGANTLLVWTHRGRVGPYMNGLHFAFGLGAFLSPLLVAQVIDAAGGYRWAYWVMAALGALIGLRLIGLSGQPRPAPPPAGEPGEPAGDRSSYPLVLAAALFLFLYVGAELAFGGWIYTYAVALGLAGAAEAAYLTSGFWLTFTLGRLLSIPTAARFAPRQIIPAALLACLVVLALLIGLPASRPVLWVAALALGFCLAPLYPMGFTLAGQSVHLTARLSGLILLGDSFGAMVLPWLVGQALDLTGPRALVYLVFGSLLGDLLAYAAMRRLGRSASPAARA